MLPAANKGPGINIGFPDVCLTPVGPAVVPIPYPNLGMHAMAAPFAATVFVTAMPGLNQASMIPLTLGDQPGVAHPTVMGTGTFTMGNPIVNIEGLPGINLLCPTAGNNMNDGLGAVLVPDAVNVFYTYASGQRAGEMSLAGIEEHLAPLRAGEIARGEMARDGVAVITLRAFAPGTASRVYDLARRLAGEGMRALVLDLRGNPGGDLSASIELCADFLPGGSEIVTVIDGDGDATVHRARGEAIHTMPLAIAVDGRTASAAEVLAGCLKAHGRAVIVGETTWGKGSAQAIVPAREGAGAVYAAAGRCVLSGGVELDGEGVRPEVEARGEDVVEAAIASVCHLT